MHKGLQGHPEQDQGEEDQEKEQGEEMEATLIRLREYR